jgi:hypothetical protein
MTPQKQFSITWETWQGMNDKIAELEKDLDHLQKKHLEAVKLLEPDNFYSNPEEWVAARNELLNITATY